MEYLMTYGWAILVIAVILGVLFQLGVFGSANLTPKAQAGNCQIERTTAGSSLAGMCQGELPQYIGVFDNPLSGEYPACPCKYVDIKDGTNFPSGSAARSLFAWVYINSNYATDNDIECAGVNWANCWYSVARMGGGCCCYATFVLLTYGVNGNGLGVGLDSACNAYESSLLITPNAWHFIGVTYGSAGANTLTFYLDNMPGNEISGYTINTINDGGSGNASIGANFDASGGFPGSIADVQYYNTSLSQEEVTALYQEGIGGAPVKPQNIVGWWPLNSNADDYSGNNNNGQNDGAGYSSSWASGYSAP